MADTNTQILFENQQAAGWAIAPNTTIINSPLSGGLDISQSEKDAIMRQIHPIFLTTHSEEKAPVKDSNFDKFLGFLRLCLEWLLKLVDIVVDAIIQIARLGVWIVAITGVLIVVTLMTNTTDKFIDLLNESVFKAFGWETRIAKVPANTTSSTTSVPSSLNSNSLATDEDAPAQTTTTRVRKKVPATTASTTEVTDTSSDIIE